MSNKRGYDPNLPANQAAVQQDSLNPSDYAMNETESAGPVNVAYDKAQQAQMTDGPDAGSYGSMSDLALPPDSITAPTSIQHHQHNDLPNDYSMRKDPK